ncbi:phosphatidate phosphatase LPIN2 isoform X1 [Archocentrus centrarchus]|uniref:phosphatidate phosphatase LPIN2 isoform X1 n=2 Tax=Archocentrus centrarchus TaxID=63155 RepID=UPI0011E9E793|nr:phosphatidate phosphatase LPIN2-like isoform X1 [Archocentrus centrarchus]
MADGSSGKHSLVLRGHLHPSLWSQTMNIVGQLAETVFVTVKELYRGLNPATLTGGIDVVVVRQPDGSFQCSPFHVRFGKLGVLRSKEKIVDIEINGESVDLHMKLGDNGEAFFVEENENMEVPAHLCTSPIPVEVAEEMEETTEGSSISGSCSRRKKRRRKRIRSDCHLKEEASSSSDERESDHTQQESILSEELATPLQLSKSVYYSLCEDPSEEVGATQTRETHPHSDGEQSSSENVFFSRSSSPKSDSELLVKTQESPGPQIQWNWGGFPTLCQPEKTVVDLQGGSSSDSFHFRTIKRQNSFDMACDPVISCGTVGSVTVVKPQPLTHSLDLGSHSTQTTALAKENTHNAISASSDISRSSSLSVNMPLTLGATLEWEGNKDLSSNSVSNCTDSPTTTESVVSPENENSVVYVEPPNDAQKQLNKDSDDHRALEASPNSTKSFNVQHQEVLSDTNSAPVSEGDSGIDPFSEGGEENGASGGTEGSAGGSVVETTAPGTEIRDGGVSLPAADVSAASSKVEQQDKKKGKRNHHLGPTDIYLDDLTTLDPEVAALYFPKSEAEGAFHNGAEQGSCSGSQSPQSVGSGAMDSGTEYLSDTTSYSMDVSMSLCGREGNTSQITKERFMEHLVTYQDFAKNPGIIEDPSLVICINSNYYNWAVAAPMVLSMVSFQKNLPKSTVECLVKDKMPKKSGRWWFTWRRRDMDSSQQKHSKEEQEEPLPSVSPTVKATLDDMDSDEAAGLGRTAVIPSSLSAEAFYTAQSFSQVYRKSLRLTSKQIERLNLHEGANKVVFSVTTQYQGTCRCEAAIYLWNWNDHVIISDIDGTITKSDALGHILPQFGKDWTHKGIAKLYHKIHQNGYKFLYCSARAIGMAAITKDYLQWVNDKGIVLPKGPVLLAPSSLFSALHREVIEKKPEVFKVACLGDIRDLFNPRRQPFYAAFGNRTNDAYAYKQVGVSETRIFTVNPKGELIQEKTKGNKSSYSRLSEMVEHFFPLLTAEGSTSSVLDCPDFSSFSYWKEPLPKLDLDALL